MGKNKQKGGGKKASVFSVNSKVSKSKSKTKQQAKQTKCSEKAKLAVEEANAVFACLQQSVSHKKPHTPSPAQPKTKISQKMQMDKPQVNVDAALQEFSKL